MQILICRSHQTHDRFNSTRNPFQVADSSKAPPWQWLYSFHHLVARLLCSELLKARLYTLKFFFLCCSSSFAATTSSIVFISSCISRSSSSRLVRISSSNAVYFLPSPSEYKYIVLLVKSQLGHGYFVARVYYFFSLWSGGTFCSKSWRLFDSFLHLASPVESIVANPL